MIDIYITIDTTGSMYPAKTEVERRVFAACRALFAAIPDLSIGIVLHGDYEDAENDYLVKALPLTRNPAEIESFMHRTGRTNGYDGPEAYEYVMHHTRVLTGWNEDSTKIMIMVGDATPHPSSDRRNFLHLDYTQEMERLQKAGITVYPVQALHYGADADRFWSKIAKTFHTPYLRLDQFNNLVEVISGIAHHQNGTLSEYTDQLQADGLFNRGLARVFNQMSGLSPEGADEVADAIYGKSDLERVPPGKFQILHVDFEQRIDHFVQRTGAGYEVGEGYYQLTKPVKVQDYKKVVLVDKHSGDMWTGPEARRKLGLPEYGTVHLRPISVPGFDVYIQSTSYTRLLKPDTNFLYKAY